MKSRVKLEGTRIVAHVATDGPLPLGEWLVADGWAGFSERPAPGWQPHWVNGRIEWRDESRSEERRRRVLATVRDERDRLLCETDWTQLPDVPASTRTKWRPYRQALRDITLQDPFSVNWPVKPD